MEFYSSYENSPNFLGIGSFTIVDGEKVSGEDVGNK